MEGWVECETRTFGQIVSVIDPRYCFGIAWDIGWLVWVYAYGYGGRRFQTACKVIRPRDSLGGQILEKIVRWRVGGVFQEVLGL